MTEPAQPVGNPAFARLPERFRWTFHNAIAHPLSEVLFQLGFGDAGDRLHDWSMPMHTPGGEGSRG